MFGHVRYYRELLEYEYESESDQERELMCRLRRKAGLTGIGNAGQNIKLIDARHGSWPGWRRPAKRLYFVSKYGL